MNKNVSTLGKKQVLASFPQRPRDSHKGLFGTVAVIGGATGMLGAPLLAARAALKLGAGCVHVGLLAENAPGVDPVQPELMLHNAKAALQLRDVDVFAVGCGLGTSIYAQKLLYEALKRNTALVLDADALNLLAKHTDLQDDLRNRKAATVLTPHPGEAARLLDCGTKVVQADRIAAVRDMAQKFACSVVLKGADSLCATQDGKLFVNHAAFIAQGMTADNAMLMAVHLHGAAGDAVAEQGISIGMTATDVTEWARYLLNKWISS
jgi:hydroxyethylthiazole kinase-like uncharacterized protein yjeF